MESSFSIFPMNPTAINIPNEFISTPVLNTCHIPTEVNEFVWS